MIFLSGYDQLSKKTIIFGKKNGINDLRNQQIFLSFLTFFLFLFCPTMLVLEHLAKEKLKNI